MGCVAFLRKPFPAHSLVDAVVKAIGQNRHGGPASCGR
jgi:hypothetical protein